MANTNDEPESCAHFSEIHEVTPSADGKSCYISWSGSDRVSRISYATGRITESVKVGDHPQRIRNGFLADGYLRHLR